MTTLFISDLHLDPARPAITQLFLEFLQTQVPDSDALYILGDLFEAWIGDDTPSTATAADAVAVALRAVADAGVPVFFMPGNRDFLVGETYAQRAGFRILPDPTVIDLYGHTTLLLHGDLLCTDDTAYQAFRAQTRDPVFQAQFLAQPLAARVAFAQQARAASQARYAELKQGDQAQLDTVTDVSPAEVEATFVWYGVDRLIHGHTHRPAIHTLQAGGTTCTRIVLGDWYAQGSVLHVDADGVSLEQLAL
ncbi:UDP-2,3-diacylglucosamine hydrolase [Xanthomonas bromi]|uniref:UDP-2,3-diacylglucosamine hydrolase n=1 Tax=Xanthomonas bromi TaxID=56449 RepID=A0A1C3NGP4_9XANT|nr:UDP-2,3-diacylglucosamine diphosphatase [Xanthomonas bromi]PPV07809.1 UDP-2,3-diacylglucosamine diphosphatase [Xanthomonas bromi]SBV49575.1 UDP-2,3-diacylglucosamine hydrolase [Xanthomonas bromi]